MEKKKYLALDDYGTGACYFFIYARNKEEIETKYPMLEAKDLSEANLGPFDPS